MSSCLLAFEIRIKYNNSNCNKYSSARHVIAIVIVIAITLNRPSLMDSESELRLFSQNSTNNESSQVQIKLTTPLTAPSCGRYSLASEYHRR